MYTSYYCVVKRQLLNCPPLVALWTPPLQQTYGKKRRLSVRLSVMLSPNSSLVKPFSPDFFRGTMSLFKIICMYDQLSLLHEDATFESLVDQVLVSLQRSLSRSLRAARPSPKKTVSQILCYQIIKKPTHFHPTSYSIS